MEADKPAIGSRWQHLKRGTKYTVVSSDARIQTETPLKDDDRVVVYVGDHGDFGARLPSEFMDGRFVEVGGLVWERNKDERIAELLAANNAEVERRRTLEKEVAHLRKLVALQWP